MGITKTLWKVVRRPMTRWWLRNGSWWLAGIVVLTIVSSMMGLYLSILSQYVPFEAMSFLSAVVRIIPLVFFVVAASICDGFVFRFYEQQAAPMPRDVLWGRYLLALCQGIPIGVTVIVVSIFSGLYWNAVISAPVSDIPGSELSLTIGAITRPFSQLAGTAIPGIWFVMFVVLAAKKPWLKYGMFLAYLLTAALDYIMWASRSNSLNGFDSPFTYPYSEYKLLFLVAFPLWMFLVDALKQGKLKLAYTVQAVLMVSLVGSGIFVMLYEKFGGVYFWGFAYVTEIINSAFYFNPGFVTPITGALASRFDIEETLLGYLPYLLRPLLIWMKPGLLLGVIYFFVFQPRHKGLEGEIQR